MENDGDAGDPFDTRIIPNCKPTSSQEEKLQSCHFAGELQVFPEDPQSSSATDESSEQATGIIMVSLPDSFDEYQTPPEQHSYSQNSSNDGQVLLMKTESIDRKIEGGGGGEGEAMVVGDESEQEAQRTVDLTKDSDNPGFSEKSARVLVEEDDIVMADVDTDQIGVESGINEVEAEIVTEVSEVELPNSLAENTPKTFVEMPLKEQDEGISSVKSKTPRKNINDIDKFRYVNTGKKRELPCSMKGQDGGSAAEDDYSKHRVLVGMLEKALKALGGQVPSDGDGDGEGGDEDESDFDFLETAKSRGLTFPQPRWWPPEGFED